MQENPPKALEGELTEAKKTAGRAVFELGALARTSHFLLEWLHCVSLCIPFGPGFLPERFLYWGESGAFPGGAAPTSLWWVRNT